MDHLWGKSRHLYLDGEVSLVRFEGTAGGSSSIHFHRHKANFLYVRSGQLDITLKDGALWRRLDPGDSTIVPAGLPHQLRFRQDSTGFELYLPEQGQVIDPADIVRIGEGRAPPAPDPASISQTPKLTKGDRRPPHMQAGPQSIQFPEKGR